MRGAKTRDALLRGAREVFERDGFVGAKIADISAAAGVATGSFYTHFADKDDALAAVLEQAGEQMLHPGIHDSDPGLGPVEMIEQGNRRYLESYRDNAALMALQEQVAAVDPRFRTLRTERARAFHGRNARAIRRLQAAGVADGSIDADLAGVALSGMVSRAAYSAFVLDAGDVDFEALVGTLTRLWANALRIA